MNRLLLPIFSMFVFTGCGEEVQCDYHGQILAEGEETVDQTRALRCLCTDHGLACTDSSPDFSPNPISRDGGEPSPDDARTPPTSDGTMVDGEADATSAPDGGMERSCGVVPIHQEQCSTPGQTCLFGPPLRCCGDEHPAQTRCVCRAGRFDCEDFDAVCAQEHGGEACLRVGRVCSHWLGTRDEMDVLDWDGDVDACDPGEMSTPWRDLVLRRLNAFRVMAGLHTVETSPELDQKAQACSLLVNAFGLDHRPPPDAPCYTEDGAEGALASLLDRRPALAALPDYIVDPGAANFRTMPHRIWMLANVLGPVGIGSTNESSCLWVQNGRVGSNRMPPFVAWPGVGPFPYDASYSDGTGWTVQSSSINLAYGEVRVFADGMPREVEARQLEGGGGAGWALAFIPVGWRSEPDTTYRVEIYHRRTEEILIEYEVDLIDCETAMLP